MSGCCCLYTLIHRPFALPPVQAAHEELLQALASLKAEEDAFANKKAELERKKEEGSVVQKSKAANELAQLLAEDPLPLRYSTLRHLAWDNF